MANNVRIAGSIKVKQSVTNDTIEANVDRRKAVINNGTGAGTVKFNSGNDAIVVAADTHWTLENYQGPIFVTGTNCRVLEFF